VALPAVPPALPSDSTALASDRPAWETSIPEWLRETARRHGERLAVRASGESLTYAGLDRCSDGIARALLETAGPQLEPVAVLLAKRPALVAALHGAWKAGKVVVPLDPSYPARRLRQICSDAGASLVITEGAHRASAASLGPAVLDLDEVAWREGADLPPVAVSADALATILYTSGSTGEPKGVVQNHRGTLHNALKLATRLRLQPGDRLSLILAAGTVGSIRDILAALLSGAAILPFDLGASGFPALGAWIRAERLTFVNMVATLFRHLMAALPGDARFPDVRAVRVGAEALAGTDLDAFRRHFAPGCVLFTGLGATETGTATELFVDAGAPGIDGRVPAGYATEGFEILVIDDAGHPCPRGEVGEVAIRSEFIALGYWGRPDLTAAAFRPDPGDGRGGRGCDGARVYLTGDLGRLRPDGCLDLVGRRDAQVKLHGVRIDLAEVELAIQAVPGVRQAAVVVRDRAPGDPQLVAYVVPSTGGGPTATALRRHLHDRLPSAMVPAVFVELPELRSTPGGKLDRRALPDPDWSATAAFVAPRTPVEEVIAGIWAEVLGASPVGVHDTFVELGGDSLRALALVDAIRDRLRLELPAAELLAASTVAEMAVMVASALAGRLPDAARARLLDRPGPA